ncbi:glycosyltransferase domain-containing protein [Curtobacterium sp. MCBD17_019]|uniref:glycosyltransferase domain-containing protein n=1 Tax=Curtobacterium sp. MCBD17_019 TaxID=2175669 RepID=UPI000DAA1954|nr:glycosyltransferase domain-containing protein [Curtobacterium sp. MCBD17_019]PZE73434.1 hypothetical protein DEI82_14345 [Curtobacterium sp. MCBD17_019]
MSAARRAVYTALLGGYEALREQPTALRSGIPYICFTDDPELTSSTWHVEQVTPLFPHDPTRSSRELKTGGHPLLADFDETLWIDNRVELTVDASDVLDVWLKDSDLTMMEHSFRERLIDEFTAVADAGIDATDRVWEQLLHYAEQRPDLMDGKPLWTGMIARRNTSTTGRFGRVWQHHIDRYSRRDQLSVQMAAADADSPIRVIRRDNRESEWHRWPPVDEQLRRRPAYHSRWEDALRAPLLTAAKLRERNRRLEQRVFELEDAASAHESRAVEAAEKLKQAKQAIRTAEDRAQALLEDLARTADQLQQEQQRNADLNHDVEDQRQTASVLRDQLAAARDELNALRSSRSFVLARRLVHILRR